jgi:transposase
MLEGQFNSFLLSKELKLISTKRLGAGYLWIVEKKRTAGGVDCPECARLTDVRARKVRVRVQDAPIREQHIYLEIHKHRFWCRPCNRYFYEPVQGIWPRKRTTQRLREHIAKACEKYTDLKSVGLHHRLSSGFVYQVYYERTEVRLRQYKSGYRWPEVLGIDEHFFRRSGGFTQFVTVFTDIKNKRLFEMAQGKSGRELIPQVENIPGREHVKVVVIDMSSSYKALIRSLFPNARIVADKFHVLRLFHPHLMRESKKISGHRQELGLRKLLLKNRFKLDYGSEL